MTGRRPREAESDRGLTLVEMLVALSILSVSLALFGAVLFVIQKSQVRFDEYSQANDGVHLAIQTLERQLRSGYVATNVAAGGNPQVATVRIYTEASGLPECVIWTVGDIANSSAITYGLYSARWNPAGGGGAPSFNPGQIQKWRLVATDITGATFTPIPSATTGMLAALKVRFDLNVPGSDEALRPDQAISVEATLTARNQPRKGEYVVVPAGPLPVQKGSAC